MPRQQLSDALQALHQELESAQEIAADDRQALLQAAKVFAGAAIDLCTKPAALRAARAEFRRRAKGFTYDPLIPKRQPVPVDPP